MLFTAEKTGPGWGVCLSCWSGVVVAGPVPDRRLVDRPGEGLSGHSFAAWVRHGVVRQVAVG
jgi:hypothetical protein